eukprot:UN4940
MKLVASAGGLALQKEVGRNEVEASCFLTQCLSSPKFKVVVSERTSSPPHQPRQRSASTSLGKGRRLPSRSRTRLRRLWTLARAMVKFILLYSLVQQRARSIHPVVVLLKEFGEWVRVKRTMHRRSSVVQRNSRSTQTSSTGSFLAWFLYRDMSGSSCSTRGIAASC